MIESAEELLLKKAMYEFHEKLTQAFGDKIKLELSFAATNDKVENIASHNLNAISNLECKQDGNVVKALWFKCPNEKFTIRIDNEKAELPF